MLNSKHGAVRAVLGLAAMGMALTLASCASQSTAPGSAVTMAGDGSYRLTTPLEGMYSYQLVGKDGDTLRTLSVDEAADRLAEFDVVFIGEQHRHPGNHLAQFDLYQALYARGADLSLSLEQFERDVQGVVDDYLAGRIGETTLQNEGRAWDNYPTSYRPLVEFSKARNLPVIAAEAPTWIVRCVGQQGTEALDKLDDTQRLWAAADLNLQDGTYKDKYMGFVAGSGGHGKSADGDDTGPSEAALRSFAGQVTRDDTMAESIYLHLQENPGRRVVHLNGTFHSESFLGTVERLALRDPDLKIAVVSPVTVSDPTSPSLTAEDLDKGTFVLLIQPSPDPYVTEEEMVAAIRAEMAQRKSKPCEL